MFLLQSFEIYFTVSNLFLKVTTKLRLYILFQIFKNGTLCSREIFSTMMTANYRLNCMPERSILERSRKGNYNYFTNKKLIIFFKRISLVLNFTVIFLFVKLSANENLLACALNLHNHSHLIKKK